MAKINELLLVHTILVHLIYKLDRVCFLFIHILISIFHWLSIFARFMRHFWKLKYIIAIHRNNRTSDYRLVSNLKANGRWQQAVVGGGWVYQWCKINVIWNSSDYQCRLCDNMLTIDHSVVMLTRPWSSTHFWHHRSFSFDAYMCIVFKIHRLVLILQFI